MENTKHKSPIRMVSRLNRLNFNFLSGPLADIGIARGTFPFLMEVLNCEGIIQEDISNSLSIDSAATARALQQLEVSGFVERQEDPEDRRRKRVFATDKARGVHDDIAAILGKQMEILFSGFEEHERAQFLNMLDRTIKNMLAPTAS